MDVWCCAFVLIECTTAHGKEAGVAQSIARRRATVIARIGVLSRSSDTEDEISSLLNG
jgi:hypothetical protein